jgi:hypothetical protein
MDPPSGTASTEYLTIACPDGAYTLDFKEPYGYAHENTITFDLLIAPFYL